VHLCNALRVGDEVERTISSQMTSGKGNIINPAIAVKLEALKRKESGQRELCDDQEGHGRSTGLLIPKGMPLQFDSEDEREARGGGRTKCNSTTEGLWTDTNLTK
jgi:hypothetical protein